MCASPRTRHGANLHTVGAISTLRRDKQHRSRCPIVGEVTQVRSIRSRPASKTSPGFILTAGRAPSRRGYDFPYWLKRASGARRAAGGAGAPSSRTRSRAGRPEPPCRRPDRQRCARRRPASRALRVAKRWPAATLDPGRRRARGLAIESAARSWASGPAHPARTPGPDHRAARAGNARIQTGQDYVVFTVEAFAMRRSGVRVPSAPPRDNYSNHRPIEWAGRPARTVRWCSECEPPDSGGFRVSGPRPC